MNRAQHAIRSFGDISRANGTFEIKVLKLNLVDSDCKTAIKVLKGEEDVFKGL